MTELRLLAPTAIVGYGFPPESLAAGMARQPHAVCVDAGSTDAGPYYLGLEPELMTGEGEAYRAMVSRDLRPLLQASLDAGVPLIIGSAGFAGGNLHLAGTVAIVHRLAAELGRRFRMATITAELSKGYVKQKIEQGAVSPLGPVPELTEEAIEASVRVVGQMGVEPFVEALAMGADVIIAGRANDPSMFAAPALRREMDRGLALHLAKILECGAIAAEPGSGSDALLGTLRPDCFLVEPLNPARRCTVMSVAAHSLYEKSDPLRLFGPGGHVDLSAAHFEQHDERTVRVSGSRFVPADDYTVKIEAARRVGFRTIAVSGIRDPRCIASLDALLERAQVETTQRFGADDVKLFFHRYGRSAVMGSLERQTTTPHEIGLVIESVAPSQALATAACGHVRSLLLHMGFAGRIATAGNLAFPFSPLDIAAGPVYEFSAYHLVDEPNHAALFPVEIMEVGS